jgi:hypothetical protein
VLTDAVKKLRDVLAFALLGVAALYLISGLSLLFKSESDAGGPFSERAGWFGYLFTHPILVVSLVVAVLLVVGFGEVSRHAKVVVLGALGLGALSLLFAVICWVTSFAADDRSGFGALFGGVLGAGKIVGTFLGIAQLAFLALAVLFIGTVFQKFPRTARATSQQWGPQQGYGPQQPYPGSSGYGPYGQPGYGQEQQGWGAAPPVPTGYAGAPGAGAVGAPPYSEQQAWGQPPAEQAGWAQPPAGQSPGWGPPAAQQWGPAPSEQAAWPQPGAEQQEWAPPPDQPEWGQPDWGQPVPEAPAPSESGPVPGGSTVAGGRPGEPGEGPDSDDDPSSGPESRRG